MIHEELKIINDGWRLFGPFYSYHSVQSTVQQNTQKIQDINKRDDNEICE